MMVLEVGPGNGRYTVASAQRVGEKGMVFTVDIEPKMIARVKSRAEVEGVHNIDARVGNVYHLDFEGESFDLIYMIAVISEIPEPIRAMKEFYRVLKPSGRLVFSELLMDPDYPLSQTLVRWATEVNFRMTQKKGNFFYYTLIFEKEVP
jgi:ubiquinone/menaquinone biosynthesis C-methylase UbiE